MAKTPPKKISNPDAAKGALGGAHKVHTGRFVNEEAYSEEVHDFGPWVMTPGSSRVGMFRYDYANRAVQVGWQGRGTVRAYMYMDVPYETFRSMIRAGSKGKFINSALNNFDYREATPDELDAPSNDKRTTPGSRAR
jgi:hypothetical protein